MGKPCRGKILALYRGVAKFLALKLWRRQNFHGDNDQFISAPARRRGRTPKRAEALTASIFSCAGIPSKKGACSGAARTNQSLSYSFYRHFLTMDVFSCPAISYSVPRLSHEGAAG
jgi:hypothetical protein